MAICLAGIYRPAGSSACLEVPAGSYSSQTITISPSAKAWWGFAASPDFRKFVATVEGSGNIWLSVDSGKSWNALESAGARNWKVITASPDFAKMIGCAFRGYMQMSLDSGGTWAPRTIAGSKDWFGVSTAADFLKMVAWIRSVPVCEWRHRLGQHCYDRCKKAKKGLKWEYHEAW